MHKKRIRTIICDDHQVIRTSLQKLFSASDEFEVLAVCKNGKEAIKKTLLLKPDILLLDINMPVMDGFEVAQILDKQLKGTGIIAISVSNSPGFVRKMMECGAKGYVTKTSPPEEFLLAAKEVCKGKKYTCKELKSQ